MTAIATRAPEAAEILGVQPGEPESPAVGWKARAEPAEDQALASPITGVRQVLRGG
jgi:hypothetical protein